MTNDVQVARVALACLVEPGSAEIHALVAERGPVDALDALLSGAVAEQVAGAVQARLAGSDPRGIAEAALARTHRLGARGSPLGRRVRSSSPGEERSA